MAPKEKLETLRFEISINSPVEEVYRIMLEEKSFLEWTSEFNATSRYKGSWDKGSKILFIGTDESGKAGGMVSRIKENIPSKLVSIEHLGILDGDKEITSGPDVEGWAGALENYIFEKERDGTRLAVELDINQQFKSYFQQTWPKALNRLKSMCEKA